MTVIPVGSEFQVNTFTTDNQRTPNIAVDRDGDFIITWQSDGQDSNFGGGIYAQRYNADGTTNGSEFQVNTFTIDNQSDPSVAVDEDGDFIITWESLDQDGSRLGIYAQRYNADGTTNGSEFQVNTFTTDTQSDPSVAVDEDGDFIITWDSSGQDGDSFGIYAQRYNADGTTNGSEFQVNTFTTSNQSDPSVAVDEDGDFIITWESLNQDGDFRGIYAQRYNADGTNNGSEFQVNTFTTSNQSDPSVAVDEDGDFIITWDSSGQDGDGLGIYAQRYNADGTTNGSEFQVNTFTTGNQFSSSVAVDEDGDFIITWQSNGQDGDTGGIYAQRYNADGTTNGSEFQVNTFTTDNQITPSVAVDEDNEFIITWQSIGQDGDDGGIYARRFTGNNSPIVANPTVDQTIVPVSNFSFTVSPNTFEDADSDPLTLSATLENGDTLPDWLNFDNSTGTFTGFPTSSDIGTISVSVTADDGGPGTPAVDTFDLTVEFSNTPNTTINISGDGSNNTINGTSANELIRGRAGNDLLDGSGGDDFIQGGNGADEIRGSSGNDLLIGNRGDDLLIGDQGDDTLVGSNGRDTLLGGAANDILDGGNGIDELQGDDGNDQLFGGNGKDNLFGGAGNDQFFLIAGTGDDNIRDFEDGIDSFVLGVGITFSDLDISDNLSGDTVIRLAGQRLATVSNTAASLIDASDFTNF